MFQDNKGGQIYNKDIIVKTSGEKKIIKYSLKNIK